MTKSSVLRGFSYVWPVVAPPSDGVWKLWRLSADSSPPDFSQRFTGTFSDAGKTIAGRWEISHDHSTWEHDFDPTCSKIA